MFSGDLENYNLLTHNCVQECSTALHEAGALSSGEGTNVAPRLDERQEVSRPLTEIDQILLQPPSGPGFH